VILAHVRELHEGAAELDDHVVGEGHVRHGGRPLLGDDGRLGVVVGDDDRRVGEDLAAGDVVGVIVAVDHVPHGLVESLLDLVFQPLRGAGVDRIGDDHARRGDRENRVVVVVPEPVDLARDLRDLADRRLRRLLREGVPGGEQHERRGDARVALHQDASVMALTAVGFSSEERSPGSLPM